MSGAARARYPHALLPSAAKPGRCHQSPFACQEFGLSPHRLERVCAASTAV
jgi:hypothetical protein